MGALMARFQPRTVALQDTILAAVRAAAPGRLTTGEVAAACGEYDVIRDVMCDGQHPEGEHYGWRFLSCKPDFARVAREGLRGNCEPATHVYRHRHDSQTVGPKLRQLSAAGLIRLEQEGRALYWSASPDDDDRAEVAALEALLKEEFRRD